MDNPNATRDVTRRGFLSDLSLSAGAVLAAGTLIGSEAAAQPVAAEYDMSWVDKLTGKYRAVFDSPDFNDGTVFMNATVFMSGFQEIYGVKDPDTQPVLVLRHTGVHMAFNDSLWEKYRFGETFKIANADKRNPYAGQIASLRNRGAIFLACQLAANFQSNSIARRMGLETQAVRADVMANLVPGVIMMPSGIFATIRAQQAGCQFIKSA